MIAIATWNPRHWLQCVFVALSLLIAGRASAAEPQQTLWRYSPDNPVVFGSLSAREIMGSKLYTQMKQDRPEVCKEFEKHVAVSLGVTPDNIDLVHLM